MKPSSHQRRVRSLKAKAATADAEFENYGAEPNMKLSHAFMVVLALHVIAVGGLFAFNKVKAGHSKVSEKLQNEIAAGQEAVAKEEAKPLVPPAVPAAVHEVEKEVQQVAKVVQSPAPQQKLKEPIAATPVNKPAVAPVAPPLTAAQKQFLATKVTTTPGTTAAVAVSSSSAVAAVANMASVTTAPAAELAPQAVSATPAASIEYTIVKGDNPYKIAKRFHVPYDQLIKFNNISDPRKIQIGQKIKIPTKTQKTTGQS